MQHTIHTAVQENNFNTRLFGWEYFFPFYFALSKVNYGRYGTYYVSQLKSLESTHPGLREMLQRQGLSFQAQDKYPLRTVVDQRGEQTKNRNAKTAGGIKSFGVKSENVMKWCLNRAEQAKNKGVLEDLRGLGNGGSTYKPARSSQVIKSEKLVKSVMDVLTEDYINPFQVDVNKQRLFCLSSV